MGQRDKMTDRQGVSAGSGIWGSGKYREAVRVGNMQIFSSELKAGSYFGGDVIFSTVGAISGRYLHSGNI